MSTNGYEDPHFRPLIVLAPVTVAAVLVSDLLFLYASQYLWLGVGLAATLCVTLTLTMDATTSWIVAVLLAVNTALLLVLGNMWLPDTFYVGIHCGLPFLFWVLVTVGLAVVGATRAVKENEDQT